MITLIKAGLFDSSLVFKNIDITPERTTKYYEIELYLSGEGSSYIDGKEYPHKRGNLLFVKPGCVRHSRNKFLCFSVHIIMNEEDASFFEDMPPAMKITDFMKFEKCYAEIIAAFENKLDNQHLLLQSKLYELCNMILSELKLKTSIKSSSTKVSPKVIEKAIDYIDTNYMQQISLKDISAYANYSPIYFHKAFKDYTGTTPHDYLEKKRLDTARLLLLTSNLSMNEICENCGFTSHSYFDYKFKKTYGVTPSTFKKERYTI